VARAGRKKKINVVRDSSGKSRGEAFDLNFHLNQPHRREFMPVFVGRNLDHTEPKLINQAGYPLGRLRIASAITGEQLRAGNEFNSLVRLYGRLNGIAIGSPKSGSMSERIASGFGPRSSDDITVVEKEREHQDVSDLYNACYTSLAVLEQAHGTGNRIRKVLRDICIVEQDEGPMWRDNASLGNLRLGLNCLAKHLLGEKR